MERVDREVSSANYGSWGKVPVWPTEAQLGAEVRTDMSVKDNSRRNVYENHGQMDINYGSTSFPTLHDERMRQMLPDQRMTALSTNMSVQDNSSGNMYAVHGRGQMVNNHGSNNVNLIRNIYQGQNEVNILLSGLRRSLNAEFDMVTKAQRGACTPDTRIHILGELKAWCRDPDGPPLHWVSGMAGTGKTTILYTLCQWLNQSDKLGASFFCSRSVDDCQDVYLILPTIAYQLATRHKAYAEALAEVLRGDPDICRRQIDVQLERLIIEPSKAAEEAFPSDLAVVLDALDECKADHSQFLQTIVENASRLPFKLLLTSRPEYVIQEIMSTTAQTAKFVLHEVEKHIVQADIVKYLTRELSSLSSPPTPAIIEFLADQAGTLFIYAATFARFVKQKPAFALRRLRSLLDTLHQKKNQDRSIMAPLNALYTSILSKVFDPEICTEKEMEDIRLVLLTVVNAREPLTRRAIAGLWNLEEDEVESGLQMLHSIIHIPDDYTKPVTTFHASFTDFILDHLRSGGFFCNAAEFHATMSSQCFEVMSALLCQNICKLKGRPPNNEIDPEIVQVHVTPALSYACRHWATHLNVSPPPDTKLLSAIRGFLLTHGIHWLECLSIVRCLGVSTVSLETLMKLISEDAELFNLTHEIYKMVQLSYDAIEYCGLESYGSALTWVPRNSPLCSYYSLLRHLAPNAVRGLPATWTGSDRLIHIHPKCKITSVAPSPDGNRIVALAKDKAIHVWNLNENKEDNALTERASCAAAITMAPSGISVVFAAGSRMRCWAVAKDEVKSLPRRSRAQSSVSSIVISRDGLRTYTGWSCGRIEVYGFENEQWHTIQSTKLGVPISYLVISPDGNRLISASASTGRVWDAKLTSRPVSLRGHTDDITAIAASPRGDLVMTGSKDFTARIWNSSGECLQQLPGHAGSVKSVAFFNDGLRAASGSRSGVIRIWDILAGSTLAVLTSHPSSVTSIALFSDDRRIVSGFSDGSMAIWTVPSIGKTTGLVSKQDHTARDEERDFEGPSTKGHKADTEELLQELEDFKYHSILPSGHVYAYHEDGWIYKKTRMAQAPSRICWIPSQYRPRSYLDPSDSQFQAFSSPDWDYLNLDNDKHQTNSIILRISHTLEPIR